MNKNFSEDEMIFFNDVLDEINLEYGLSYARIAEIIGTSYDRLYNWKSGINEPSFVAYIRLLELKKTLTCPDRLWEWDLNRYKNFKVIKIEKINQDGKKNRILNRPEIIRLNLNNNKLGWFENELKVEELIYKNLQSIKEVDYIQIEIEKDTNRLENCLVPLSYNMMESRSSPFIIVDLETCKNGTILILKKEKNLSLKIWQDNLEQMREKANSIKLYFFNHSEGYPYRCRRDPSIYTMDIEAWNTQKAKEKYIEKNFRFFSIENFIMENLNFQFATKFAGKNYKDTKITQTEIKRNKPLLDFFDFDYIYENEIDKIDNFIQAMSPRKLAEIIGEDEVKKLAIEFYAGSVNAEIESSFMKKYEDLIDFL